jgi:hypothetical protein
VGAWASPALLAWLATRVVAGDENAPLLGLLAVLAALGALLAGSRRDPGPIALTAATGSMAVSMALAGSVLAVAEAGVAFGVSPGDALAIAMGVACAGALLRHVSLLPAAALALSPVALAAIVMSMALHTDAAPWVMRLARPRPVFPVRHGDGGRAVMANRLTETTATAAPLASFAR